MRITLCGSTKFIDAFNAWNARLTLAGHTVYSLGVFGKEAGDQGKDGNLEVTERQKMMLDLVHLDKILNSDAIVVINQGGYIGASTRREIAWAALQGREIYYIEPFDVIVENRFSVANANDLIGYENRFMASVPMSLSEHVASSFS